MLVAMCKDGLHVSLFDLSYEQALSMKRQKWYCPACTDAVLPKIGRKIIPHFAHYPHSTCSLKLQGESYMHHEGKNDLFKFLVSAQQTTQLEPYLITINRRPDLLISQPHQKWVVEYQCSSVPEDNLIQRIEDYESIGLESYWIIGNEENHTGTTIRFKKFQLILLRYTPSVGYYLFFYSPKTKLVDIIVNPVAISQSVFFYTNVRTPLHQQTFPFSIYSVPQVNMDHFLHTWFNHRNKTIYYKVKSTKSYQDAFLLEVYKQGHFPYYLPLFIGIPCRHSIHFHTHPLIWQYYIWTDSLLSTTSCTLFVIKERMKERIRKGDIAIRYFPLIKKVSYEQAIEDYLRQLVHFRCIEVGKDSGFSFKNVSLFQVKEEDIHEQKKEMDRQFKKIG
ncbi:competence protein CoiA [Bacillus coahuilensis]|uniref:competence protein CoiA n=1 Tax=Bacillus coahuilensis TaxID=408580 RepID=UPI0001850B12|nr:competence protein CoiA family protein [Bacillus coahuilensis]